MKKSVALLFLLASVMTFASAEACDLSVSLLNQDPYPAVPGEYVKLVFQVSGIDSPECGDITFELLEDYPLVFDPWQQREYLFRKVDYVKDYKSTLQIPYEVRIDEDALDGVNPIEISVRSRGKTTLLRTFNIEVQDTSVLFETHIQDYDYATKELTIQILNIGESDIEALTLEIPKQESIDVKGSNRVVVGDLDSNEFTSADFEAIPRDGEIVVDIYYSDSINVRRRSSAIVTFDSSYFTDRVRDQKKTGAGTYVLYIVLIGLIVWWAVKRMRKKKKK